MSNSIQFNCIPFRCYLTNIDRLPLEPVKLCVCVKVFVACPMPIKLNGFHIWMISNCRLRTLILHSIKKYWNIVNCNQSNQYPLIGPIGEFNNLIEREFNRSQNNKNKLYFNKHKYTIPHTDPRASFFFVYFVRATIFSTLIQLHGNKVIIITRMAQSRLITQFYRNEIKILLNLV